MPEFDATFWITVLSFLVFMVWMRSVYFVPVARVKAERERALAADRAEADRLANEASEYDRAVEEALRTARAQSQTVLQDARQAALKDVQARITEAKAQAQTELESALAAIREEQARLADTLSADRDQLTGALVDRLLGRPSPVLEEAHR